MEGTVKTDWLRRKAFHRMCWQAAMIVGVVIVVGIFFGCQQGSGDNPLVPGSNETLESLASLQVKVRDNPNIIHHPQSAQGCTRISVTDSIDAAKGGKIVLNSTFLDKGNKPVSINIQLTFPPEALSQSTNITVSLDSADLIADISFGPHGTTFNHPVLLDVAVSGFDFTGYTDGSVDAWYVDQGQWVEMLQAKKIIVNPTAGILVAQNVELHHFSRYAFGR